mmetsp:Transcript_46770/g.124233  ORF Transcript_46770/g.124233 Transcript_46770/m.124233 type:complete len:219 (-) Transcript_46770:665-1321(-)
MVRVAAHLLRHEPARGLARNPRTRRLLHLALHRLRRGPRARGAAAAHHRLRHRDGVALLPQAAAAPRGRSQPPAARGGGQAVAAAALPVARAAVGPRRHPARQDGPATAPVRAVVCQDLGQGGGAGAAARRHPRLPLHRLPSLQHGDEPHRVGGQLLPRAQRRLSLQPGYAGGGGVGGGGGGAVGPDCPGRGSRGAAALRQPGATVADCCEVPRNAGG